MISTLIDHFRLILKGNETGCFNGLVVRYAEPSVELVGRRRRTRVLGAELRVLRRRSHEAGADRRAGAVRHALPARRRVLALQLGPGLGQLSPVESGLPAKVHAVQAGAQLGRRLRLRENPSGSHSSKAFARRLNRSPTQLLNKKNTLFF